MYEESDKVDELNAAVEDKALFARMIARVAEDKSTKETMNFIVEGIGRNVAADRSYVFIFREVEGRVLAWNTYEWCAEGTAPMIDSLQGIDCEMFSQCFESLRAGRLYSFTDITQFSPQLRELFASQGIQALIMMPFFKPDGTLDGMFGFDFVNHAPATFSDRIIENVKEAANIVVFCRRLEESRLHSDRANKERLINASMALLATEHDFQKALSRILAMWCKELAVQWCMVGHWAGDQYHVIQSYTEPGEACVFEPDSCIDYCKPLNEGVGGHVDHDLVEFTDFPSHPLYSAILSSANNADVLKKVASAYSHVIRVNGKPWGTVVLMFREHRELSENEVRFFKSAVQSFALAIVQKEYQEKLAQERDRALAAEKARSMFFSIVSHDIRTPLNAIVGFSELLEQGVANACDRNRFITMIRSSGKVLARLVNDVLDLSKLESGNLEIIKEPTDVMQLAHEVFDTFEVARARKPIVFKDEICEMPRVVVDQQRLRQLVFNLISNAFKYTDRGQIILRTTWRAGTLTLAVEDTGKGIPEADIKRILLPFVQVVDRNHRNGTGLGLTICQRLVELMGGKMTIQSVVGKGSTFTITLTDVEVAKELPPDATAAPGARTVESGKEALRLAAAQRKLRVLVVDDSSVNRMVIKSMLMRCGATEVVQAENGKLALDILRQDNAFDLIFSDYWMPVMDGEAFIKALRADAAFRTMPVYLVTADVEAVTGYQTLGFTGILLKPITMNNVMNIFEEKVIG